MKFRLGVLRASLPEPSPVKVQQEAAISRRPQETAASRQQESSDKTFCTQAQVMKADREEWRGGATYPDGGGCAIVDGISCRSRSPSTSSSDTLSDTSGSDCSNATTTSNNNSLTSCGTGSSSSTRDQEGMRQPPGSIADQQLCPAQRPTVAGVRSRPALHEDAEPRMTNLRYDSCKTMATPYYVLNNRLGRLNLKSNSLSSTSSCDSKTSTSSGGGGGGMKGLRNRFLRGGVFTSSLSHQRTPGGGSGGSRRTARNPGTTNIVVLGDKGVGKSAVIVRFLTRRFIGEYSSQAEMVYQHDTLVDHAPAHLQLLDAHPAQTGHQILRHLPWADAFVVVYDVTSRTSFIHARQVLHSLHSHSSTTPTDPLMYEDDMRTKRQFEAQDSYSSYYEESYNKQKFRREPKSERPYFRGSRLNSTTNRIIKHTRDATDSNKDVARCNFCNNAAPSPLVDPPSPSPWHYYHSGDDHISDASLHCSCNTANGHATRGRCRHGGQQQQRSPSPPTSCISASTLPNCYTKKFHKNQISLYADLKTSKKRLNVPESSLLSHDQAMVRDFYSTYDPSEVDQAYGDHESTATDYQYCNGENWRAQSPNDFLYPRCHSPDYETSIEGYNLNHDRKNVSHSFSDSNRLYNTSLPLLGYSSLYQDHNFGHNRNTDHQRGGHSSPLKPYQSHLGHIPEHHSERGRELEDTKEEGHVRGYTTLLLGNKRDLEHCRCVWTDEGEALSLEFSCQFYEVSAADSVVGVHLAFHSLLKEARALQVIRSMPHNTAKVSSLSPRATVSSAVSKVIGSFFTRAGKRGRKRQSKSI